MKPSEAKNIGNNLIQDKSANSDNGNIKSYTKKIKIGNLNITEIENIYFLPRKEESQRKIHNFRLETIQEETISFSHGISKADRPKADLANFERRERIENFKYPAKEEQNKPEKILERAPIEEEIVKTKVKQVLQNLVLPRVEKPILNRQEIIENAQVIQEEKKESEDRTQPESEPEESKIPDKPSTADLEIPLIEELPLKEKISAEKIPEKEKAPKEGAKAPQIQDETIPEFKGAKYTIKFKLITITSLIIFTSLTAMILLATNFFKQDNKIRIDESNLKLAEVIAQKIKTDFFSLVEKARMMAIINNERNRTETQKKYLIDLFFENNEDMIFLGIAAKNSERTFFNKELTSQAFMSKNAFTQEDIKNLHAVGLPSFQNAFAGQILIQNLSQGGKLPVIGLAIPFEKSSAQFSSIIVLYLKLENMLKTFKTTGIIQAFMTNGQGDILAHADSRVVFSNANWVELPIIKRMITSKLDNGKTRYNDENGQFFLGAFKKLGIGGLGVITTVAESIAYEAVYAIQRRNLYILVIGLNIAVLIIYFFAKTLTTPIIRLVGATKKIEEGQFHLNIRPTTRDEIGALTNSFIAMGRGLEEREKMKDAFGKFVNKEIAEQAMKGEIKLGGERKMCAIFFSDIRGFTAISESLEPEEVVEFLNEYMTEMVHCINDTHGVVDKYIGDAIMAHWGALVSKGNDTENAVNAALLMRKALIKFNIGRGGAKKPIIKFGAGINTGPVISGQIGSNERLEYTIIGDAVNLASRVESLNKPFGTDILVTQDSKNLVSEIFEFEAMPPIKVKGKSEPQAIYAVLGRKDDPDTPKSMNEVRKIVGIDFDSSKKISAEEKEVKYEIIGQ